MCIDEWHPTASMFCPLSLPCKKIAGVRSQLFSKQSSKGPFLENFLPSGGFFEHNTYRVTVIGCLKKKRKKKMNNSDLQLCQVCHFKIVTTHCYYSCRLGQTLYGARCTFRRKHLFLGDDITVKKLIQRLEPPF